MSLARLNNVLLRASIVAIVAFLLIPGSLTVAGRGQARAWDITADYGHGTRANELTGRIEMDDVLFQAGDAVHATLYVNSTTGPYSGQIYVVVKYEGTPIYNDSNYIWGGYDYYTYYLPSDAKEGYYTMVLMNYSMTYEFAWANFTVYEPQYTAVVRVGKDDSDGFIEKSVFTKSDYVDVTAHITDQFGGALPDWTRVDFQVIRGGKSVAESYDYTYDGNASITIYSYQKSQGGVYTVEVYLDDMKIGTASFRVIAFSDIELDSYVYSPGEEMLIDISVDLDRVKIDIQDENGNSIGVPASWSTYELPETGNTTLRFTLPETLPDGDYRVLIWTTDDTLLDDEYFQVKYYTLYLTPERSVYLPGENIRIFYYVVRNLDDELVSEVNLDIDMIYYRKADNEGGDPVAESLSVIHNSMPGKGEIEVPLQSNAADNSDGVSAGNIYLTIWANDTAGKHSAVESQTLHVGIGQVHLRTDTDTYAMGDFMAGEFFTGLGTQTYT